MVGVGVGYAVAPKPPAAPAEAVAVQELAPVLDASAGVVAHTWGMEIKLTASGFAAGQTYRAVVLDRAGRQIGAGEFVGTGAQQLRCNLNSSVLRPDATGFVITDAAGTPVLTSGL